MAELLSMIRSSSISGGTMAAAMMAEEEVVTKKARMMAENTKNTIIAITVHDTKARTSMMAAPGNDLLLRRTCRRQGHFPPRQVASMGAEEDPKVPWI